MCFRPSNASASEANKCPECGKAIPMLGGVVLMECPFCKCDFSPYINPDGTPKMKAPSVSAPAAPGASLAPDALKSPKPPAAPGASAVSKL